MTRPDIDEPFEFAESHVDTFTSSIGLWYWFFTTKKHSRIFNVLVIMSVVIFGNELFSGTGISELAKKFGIAGIVIFMSVLVSQIIHNGWPKPSDGITENKVAENNMQRRNLAGLLILLLSASLLAHELLSQIGVLKYLNGFIIYFAHYFDGNVLAYAELLYESTISVFLTIGIFWVVEKCRGRISHSTKTKWYVLCIALICVIAHSLISLYWV